MLRTTRQFTEIATEHDLTKFLTSEVGTLFYASGPTGRTLVRKFLTATELEGYVGIFRAFSAWLMNHPGISAAVELVQPKEVGADFVARPHLIYTSTHELRDKESHVELAPRFFDIMARVASLLEGEVSPAAAIVHAVVRQSILEPTGKTFFDFSVERFCVAEPKIMRKDIDAWNALPA